MPFYSSSGTLFHTNTYMFHTSADKLDAKNVLYNVHKAWVSKVFEICNYSQFVEMAVDSAEQ